MLQKCKQCPSYNNNVHPIIAFLSNDIEVDKMENIRYSIWSTVSISNKKDSSSIKRISLTEFNEPFQQLLKSTAEDILNMMTHHFISIKQKEYYCLSREQVDHDSGILCMDFAENYTPIAQDSIQGLYFNNRTITLFTVVLYYKDMISNDVRCQSYCIISDTSIHQAYSVHIFQEAILNDMKVNYPNIKSLTYWSDGAPTQFKNKYDNILLSK